MKIGLEILTQAGTRLTLGTFFESWLCLAEGTLKRSLGRDEYHLHVSMGPGRRLAATGRTHICQLDSEAAGLGPNQAAAAVLVPVSSRPEAPLFLGMRTNAFLDMAAFTSGAALRLVREGTDAVVFTLDHPDVAPHWVGPGRFLIQLPPLLGCGQ